ncbi:response regulator [Roseivirga echinicomitans]
MGEVETLTKIRKVLVVEDEIIIADDIAMIIAKMGFYPLAPVFDYDSAINSYNTHNPDLVIIDIRLQGNKTGIQLAEWIRTCFNTPIIYITVMGSKTIRQQAGLTQPTAYLIKPFVNQDLVDAVRSIIDQPI